MDRIGVDEFLVFMPCIEEENLILERVEQLYQNISAETEVLSQTSVSCSMGSMVSESAGQRFNELFLAADEALYQAKNEGRNRYVFAPR